MTAHRDDPAPEPQFGGFWPRHQLLCADIHRGDALYPMALDMATRGYGATDLVEIMGGEMLKMEVT
jgi:hypothetical protein